MDDIKKTELKMEECSKSGKFPFFIVGTVLGVISGLLLAPDSGEENRRRLADWLEEKRMKGAKTLISSKDQVADVIEAGKKEFKKKKEKVVG